MKDLNELALTLQRSYKEEFDSKEILLSDSFKETYGTFLRSISQDIDYTQHTATITSAGNLKMYIPNQWFRAAAFMVPYVSEIVEYKKLAEKILSEKFESVKDKKQYYSDMKNTKDTDAIERLRKWITDYCDINAISDDGIVAEQLTSFISNYEWWFGSKTIDRGDYYVSPVLALLGVVNASQSYIADISYNLATHAELAVASEEMLKSVSEEDEEGEIFAPAEIINSEVERKKGGINEIVYGAPGTGKSRYLADKYKSAPLTRRVVFHSEYSYYDFIGVYKPVPIYKNSNDIFNTIDGQVFTQGEPYIDYQFVPGPFIRVLVEAWLDPGRMHTLLIEEINRADAAAVFGEIFQLLDRDVDGNSEYSFEPSRDLKEYLASIVGMKFYIEKGISIPSNMNIVATMNSADQGVKPMDSAFKRRWNFHYVRINIKGAVHENAKIRYAGRECYWGTLISIINQKLAGGTIQLEEDKLIGPYFIKPDEVGKKRAIDKLLLYLWDDVLRHYRDSFFSNEIKTFASLSEKFEEEDVLDIIHPPFDIDMLISDSIELNVEAQIVNEEEDANE
ncbi:dynein-related subfamily AAA family protein [Kineothrix alysoides]|uniref:Dynein-related subfamily AAA family protein n=1 Tax=Kineothrix alysoides TaxID=1469948 RepID=A0A4R1R4W8_9FIRM|nr:AAA family ATPase [Kineothrix alysoides]TCL60534.1 dynein-related subfamily AAA family protein [Kineothrix alysoides]